MIHDVKHLHIRVIVLDEEGTAYGGTVERLSQQDGRSVAFVRFTRPKQDPSHGWFLTSELIPEAM